MIREAIAKVVERENLEEKEMRAVMEEIMTGQATPSQIASFITALRMKGESLEEILGAVRIMREKVIRVEAEDALDIVGTGGDGRGTFNISTCSAFVLAGGGVKVAKHGNRSASSLCGSADVLERLGAKIEIKKDDAERMLEKIGFCFLFAPYYHTSLKYAAGPRKEIGIRTIFNLCGPLANPAFTPFMVIGVSKKELSDLYGSVLSKIGVKRAVVIYGMDGIDEASLSDKTYINEIEGGRIKNYFIEPEDFGFKRRKVDELKGGNIEENARILREILEGKERGTKREAVLINAALGFFISGMAKSVEEGICLAEKAIDSGRALRKLEEFIEESKRCS